MTITNFHCYKCNKYYRNIYTLHRHYDSKKHKINNYGLYHCKLCNYQTKKKTNYTKHCKTKKHKNNTFV